MGGLRRRLLGIELCLGCEKYFVVLRFILFLGGVFYLLDIDVVSLFIITLLL